MIDFVLNDLCRPARVGFDVSMQFQGLILNLDRFIAFARTRATEKRQTSFFGVVRTVFFHNFRIEHHRVCRNSSTLIKKSDNALPLANHISRHTTQLCLCAINVSSKSCATCKSSFVATSDFPARNIGSCIRALTIYILRSNTISAYKKS